MTLAVHGRNVAAFGPLSGLGAIDPRYNARLLAVHSRYSELKGDVQALLLRYPTPIQPTPFRELVRQVEQLRRGGVGLVSLTGEQFAMVLKAALSVVGQNLGMAAAMASAPSATVGRRAGRIEKLISSAERVISGARLVVDGAQYVSRSEAEARRVAGLGAIITETVVVSIVAGVVAVIAIGLILALLGYIAVAVESYQAAERACAADAAAGHPCSGEDWSRYHAEAQEAARNFGLVPDFNDLMERVGDLVFYGGMAVVAAFIGYSAFIAAPAAREARSWLHDETSRARTKRFAGFSARWRRR